MAAIRFSPAALSDLKETKAYIAQELGSEQAALHTVTEIVSKIRRLSAFPEAGAPLSSIVDLETDYRFLVCGHYTAFYRVETGTVYIVRVLYSRRDFMRVLFEEVLDS